MNLALTVCKLPTSAAFQPATSPLLAQAPPPALTLVLLWVRCAFTCKTPAYSTLWVGSCNTEWYFFEEKWEGGEKLDGSRKGKDWNMQMWYIFINLNFWFRNTPRSPAPLRLHREQKSTLPLYLQVQPVKFCILHKHHRFKTRPSS